MNLTDQHRKWLWIAVAAIAVLHFGPRMLSIWWQAVLYHHHAAAIAKPSPAHPMPQAQILTRLPERPLPAAAPLSASAQGIAADSPFTRFTGTWSGSTLRPNGMICKLRFELSQSQEKPGGFTGYTTMSCGPVVPIQAISAAQRAAAARIIDQMRPVSAVLSGSPENGELMFTVDRVIGSAADGCKLSNFTVTPFGATQIAAQWEEQGGCKGGQMIMQRAPKGAAANLGPLGLN
jgi:hypothetical protein